MALLYFSPVQSLKNISQKMYFGNFSKPKKEMAVA